MQLPMTLKRCDTHYLWRSYPQCLATFVAVCTITTRPDCACTHTMATQAECCGWDMLLPVRGLGRTTALRPLHVLVCMSSIYCTFVIFMKVIPHNFGRQRPPIIVCQSMVENKIRMCDVLSDIEVAQDMLEPKEKEEDRVEMQPNPADEKYASLMADLEVIPAKEEEFKIIEKYCQVGFMSICVRATCTEHKVVRPTVNSECCLSLEIVAQRCVLLCMLMSKHDHTQICMLSMLRQSSVCFAMWMT